MAFSIAELLGLREDLWSSAQDMRGDKRETVTLHVRSSNESEKTNTKRHLYYFSASPGTRDTLI